MRSLFYLSGWHSCAGVCTCFCVCLAGTTRLGQTSLVPSRWVTWLGGVLACSQWPVWFHYWEVRDTHTHTHTHTWANYCAVSLICHVEGVTQTCTTHKHKQTVTNANMPHFTHVRANAHKHTVSPPRPTHAYLYNLSQQPLLLLKPTEPQTYWNWLYYFVLHILYNIMLMPFAFFLTQQLRSSICFLIEVICT